MKKNIFTKICSCFLVCMSVFSIGTMMAGAAGNYSDTYKTYNYNGDGGPLATPLREKWDDTSSYVKNYSVSTTSFSAGVGRSRTSRGYLADRYYSSSNGAFNMGKLKSVGIGQERYLPNFVYEDGYKYANVHFYPSRAGYISIAWSPDSV